jgi:hypothetical protein
VADDTEPFRITSDPAHHDGRIAPTAEYHGGGGVKAAVPRGDRGAAKPLSIRKPSAPAAIRYAAEIP